MQYSTIEQYLSPNTHTHTDSMQVDVIVTIDVIVTLDVSVG